MKKSKRIMVLILLVITVFNSTNVLGEELGSWTTKISMPYARFDLGVVEANGKIYALGGFNFTNKWVNIIEEYDPVTNKWITDNMPARSGFGVVELNDKIYVMGGSTPDGRTKNVEEYDPVTRKWTTKADMITDGSIVNGVEINGKIYATSERVYSMHEYLITIDEYDAERNYWKTKSIKSIDRANCGVVEVNGKIYIIGGYNRSNYLDVNTVEEYDPVTNMWTTKADMPTARYGMGLVQVDGKIYAIGGLHENEYINTVEEYDSVKDTWTTKTNMPTARGFLGLADIDDKIYAIGGRAANTVFNTVEEFNLSTTSSAIYLNIEPNNTQISPNQKTTVDLVIDNITEIAAEDIKIVYDKDKLEFIDFQEASGKKLVKSIHEPEKGELRVILASEGEPNIINGKETLLKLNFKGIQTGEALVDIVSGRVTDGISMEKDLTPQQCGQATITVEDIIDVNYSGEFTLLDLGIDARHLYKTPSEPELSGYNTDIIIDGTIDELDLLEIAKYMLENATYAPNN